MAETDNTIVPLDTLNMELEKLQPDWPNAPDIDALKQDFNDAQIDKDTQAIRISTYLDNLYIKGSAKPQKRKGRSAIQPMLIRKHAEWRYAALSEPFLGTEDLYEIAGRTWEDKEAAEQNSLVLNAQFNTKIDRTRFIDEYVRTAVNEGTVIVKLGWDFEEEERTFSESVYEYIMVQDPQAARFHQEIHAKMQQDPSYFDTLPPHITKAHLLTMQNQVPYMPNEIEQQERTGLFTVRNQPTLEVCDYRNITIDPTALGDFDKARFVVFSFETSKAELEKEGDRYKNLDAINVEGASPLGDPDHDDKSDSSFNFQDEPRKKFIAYEYWGYWDIDDSGELTPIVATWVGDVLIRMEKNPFPDKKLPFVVVSYMPIKNSVYGEPDGALLEDNQKVIGAMTRGMIDVMGRSANGQTGIRKDALDMINRRKFENNLDYEFNANVDPRQAIHEHTFPDIPASAQYLINLNNVEAEGMTGVKAFHEGLSGTSLGDTATGIRGALDAASKRELGILRRLANGIVQIGRKIIAMNAVWLEEEEIVRITNDMFIPVRRDDLAGEFDLKVTVTTAEADNVKAQELAFMLQTIGNNDPGIRKIILTDIAKLRKMPDLARKIETYQPQPSPLEQARQEAEIQALQAQIEKDRAAAFENAEQGKLYQAQQHKAIAEARLAGSKADMEDLKYVQEETGTNHVRDVERIKSQSDGNAETEVLKYQLGERAKDKDFEREVLSNALAGAAEPTEETRETEETTPEPTGES